MAPAVQGYYYLTLSQEQQYQHVKGCTYNKYSAVFAAHNLQSLDFVNPAIGMVMESVQSFNRAFQRSSSHKYFAHWLLSIIRLHQLTFLPWKPSAWER